MYNKKGNIFASSFVQRIKNFVFGCEGVYIKDHKKMMSAVAVGYESDKAQMVLQLNDQMSGCLGFLYQYTPQMKMSMKLNAKYMNQ